MKSMQWSLLSVQRFLPLFVTQFLGAFNDNVFKNALIILMTFKLATLEGLNSQLWVTAAAGLFILPFFLFSALAGQLADKYPKAPLIMLIKSFEIVLMVVAAVGFHLQSLTLLMSVIFALGLHSSFFGPLKYAILPEQLPESELLAANGLIEAGTFIAIILGTLLGGWLILQSWGASFISSVMIIIAVGGYLASGFIPKMASANPQLKLCFNMYSETVVLIRFAAQQRQVFLSILGISWFWLVGTVFLTELPVFTRIDLHASPGVVTFFLVLFSLGLAAGSLLCNRLLKGKIHAGYVPLATLAMTGFMLDLYFASKAIGGLHHPALQGLFDFLQTGQGVRVSIDLLGVAMCGGLYTVPLYVMLQKYSQPEHRARTIAANNVVNALFMVAAALLAGVLLWLGCSVSQVFLIVALMNALVAFYICRLLPGDLFKIVLRWLLVVLYRVEVKGLDHYHQAGKRVVIIANHTSFLDALLLAAFLPGRLTFAVNTLIAQQWWAKIFLKWVHTFSVDPTNPMSIKSLIEHVRQDKRCVIFPEGRLTMTGALMKIYEGPGLVADKSLAPLLPIRIQGAQFSPFSRLRGKLRIRLFPKITITIFKVQQFTLPAECKGRARRQMIGRQLYDVMSQMMFDSSDCQATLFSALLDARHTHGRSHSILEDIQRRPIHYQRLLVQCFILGDLLAKHSKAGDYVGVLLPNTIATVSTFFGLQAYDRVPAMLNYSMGPANVLVACQTAQLRVVLTSRQFVTLAKLDSMIERLQQAGLTVVYLEDLKPRVTLGLKLKGWLMARMPHLAYACIGSAKTRQADQAAVVLFTSGSEGTPKGVVLSHANIHANRHQLCTGLDFTSIDKVFNALPLFHAFGLTGGLILPLLSGVKIFLYPSPLHYRIVPEMVYDTNATILFATDTFLSGYGRLANAFDFYSVRYVFAGAEKLRDETRLNWAQKFGLRILEGYGATEAAPGLAINTPLYHKVGSVGRFLPGIQYRLETVPGIEVGGLLHVCGPNIMLGYLHAAQPGVLVPPTQGWYDTGDIVSVDEQGFVTIHGRVKRFAKVAGEMVSLPMVEQHVQTLWPNHQHAVVAIPDARKGEQIVLMTDFSDAQREDLTRYATQVQMAEIAVPKRIHIVKALPLLGTGKVDYVLVKTQILGDA